VVAVFAVGASAYDFLDPGDTAMTHDAGGFGIGGGLMYLMADEYYDDQGEAQDFEELLGTTVDWTAMWIPIHVYYAAMDNLEFGVNAKFGMLDVEPGEGEAADGSGLGDTWIWAKYMFMPDPMMTARLGFMVPTGNEPFHPALFTSGFYGFEEDTEDANIATGKGDMAIDGALMFGVPAGPGQFDAAVGYRYYMAREITMDEDWFDRSRDDVTFDYKCGNEIHFAAGYTYYIGEMMSLCIAADGFFGSDDKEDYGDESRDSETVDDTAANAIYINPAFYYTMDNGTMLGVDMTYPLTGQNVPAEWGLGLYVGWGM
jgi:hypothetical protein